MNYKITVINSSSKQKWEKALEDIESTAYHSYDYCQYVAKACSCEVELFVYKTEAGKVVLPFAERSTDNGLLDIFTVYGFGGFCGEKEVLNSKKFIEDFFSWSRERNYVTAYILQTPYVRLGEMWSENLFYDHTIYVMDLKKNESDLKRSMAKKSRYELNKLLIDKDVQLSFSKERLLPCLKKMYEETLDRVGNNSTLYRNLSLNFDMLVNSEKSFLVGAEVEGQIKAISVFLMTGLQAEYFLNASIDEGRKYSRLLIWSAIEFLKENGIERLNLGGGIKSEDSLDKFKKHFGGVQIFGQSLKIIYDRSMYDRLCASVECCGDGNYFPRYRSRCV